MAAGYSSRTLDKARSQVGEDQRPGDRDNETVELDGCGSDSTGASRRVANSAIATE